MEKFIFFEPKGRLGNALFRYFAIIVMLYHNKHLKYGGKNKNTNNYITITDDIFKNIIINKNFKIEKNNLFFNGFYQLQELVSYKEQIKYYLKTNQKDIIYNYPYEEFRISNLINKPDNLNLYDIVLHIRLEDFINNKEYISCDNIINLLNTITYKFFMNYTTTIVMNKPKTEFEIKYVERIKQWFINNNININIESNSVLIDFHIMKNAKKLICSNSTLSWCAALLSDTINTCYMPDYKIRNDRSHQTFKFPIQNTILYSIYD